MLFSDEVGRQSIRRITTQLQSHASPQKITELSPFLVTSAEPREGKSEVAAALAMLASRELGLKTVIVDLNWDEPRLHRIFNIESEFNVSELLERGPMPFIRSLGSDAPSVLTAPRGAVDLNSGGNGGATSSSSRRSKTFTQVRDYGAPAEAPPTKGQSESGRVVLLRHLESLEKQFEIVIFDGPAVYEYTPGPLDAVQLAMSAKAALLVVLTRATRREVVKRACMELQGTTCKFVGSVANNLYNPLYQ